MRSLPSFYLAGLAGIVLFAGCATPPAPAPAAETVRIAPGDAGKCLVIDPAARAAIAFGETESHTLADGRREVLANLENRLDRTVTVQAQCVFAGEDGAQVGTAPWQAVEIAAHATETARFDASDVRAGIYLVRVRTAP